MIFIFQCPNCDGAVKADSAHGGDIAVCPHCDATLMVPMDAVGAGTLVGGYKLLERVGSGGMGTVYLAEQISLKRMVALKVLPPAITRSEKFVQRFRQEVKMHGQLTHPRIAMAYDAGNDRDIHYLAMEYVKGTDVGRLILTRKVLPEQEALRIALAVAEGLDYAWEKKKIVHCDIKPGNLMVLDDGDVKILDMGLSKSLIDMADLTQTGYMVGTPLYMSPEQADGDSEVDFRSDIYSLGSTLYHMVTGVTPYQGRNVTEVITKKNSGDPPTAAAMCKEVGEPCSRLIAKMMARRPEDRFQSYADLMQAIRQAMEGRVPELCREENFAGRVMWIVAGLILAATAVGVTLKLGGRPTPTPPPQPPAQVGEETARKKVEDLFRFALGRTRLNPAEPQLHLDTFEAVRKEAEACGHIEVARLAAEQVAKFRDTIDHEVNVILDSLRNRAEEQAAEGNLTGAQMILLGYEGPFRRESETRRAELWKTLEAAVSERQRHEQEAALATAREQGRDLIREGRFDEAERLIADVRRGGRQGAELARTNLAGELADALADARKQVEARERRAAAELEALVAGVADRVLAGDIHAAEAAAAAAPPGPARDDLLLELRRVAQTGSTILNSFADDIGHEVELWLLEGPKTYRIEEVRDADIVAARAQREGTVTVSLRLSDLTPGEKVRRLVQAVGERESAISCGMLAWTSRNPRAAAGYFEKAGTPLGRALAARAQSAAQEKDRLTSAPKELP